MVDADPTWPARFAAEAARIRAALGPVALRVDHVGSTAVPGLAAKPIIDIQISVAQVQPMDPYRPALEGLGYLHTPYPDPDGVVRYPFFGKPPTRPRAFHIHVAQAGSRHERRHLAVRDFLRAHPDQPAATSGSNALPWPATPVTGQATWQPSRRSWTTSSAARWSGTTSGSLQDDLGSPGHVAGQTWPGRPSLPAIITTNGGQPVLQLPLRFVARRSHSGLSELFDSPVTRAGQISLTTAALSGRMRAMASDPQPTAADVEQRWLTLGVRGIGAASFLADVGHEIPTALLPNLLTVTLGAPAAALGLIEGIADGLAGAARLAGGAIADDPQRRRAQAIAGYTTTAILSSLIGAATSVWQVGILRAGAWAARGLRVPARNALLADIVPASVYGRAYGFERAMDNLGAIAGPLLALALVGLVGVRTAIALSIIPGLLAALAIVYAIRHAPRAEQRERQPLRLRIRPVLTGRLGRLMVGVSAFEFGNVAATLLILRAGELLAPGRGQDRATRLALGLYVAYNAAATVASIPAGRLGGRRGAVLVLVLGVGLAYAGFAAGGSSVLALAPWFVAAGVAIG